MVIDDNFKTSIGTRLKKLREEKNYTIIDFINICQNQYCDINEKTIRRYEKGESIPKLDNLIIFSEIFDVSLDYIIFGKETTDENSFTWKDSFKRLNRLVYSCVLLPFSVNDNNKTNYIFAGFDDELNVYINKLFTFCIQKNYNFENRGKSPDFTIHDLDNLIQGFEDINEQLVPTKERVDYLLNQSGINPEEFLINKIIEIEKKRNKK